MSRADDRDPLAIMREKIHENIAGYASPVFEPTGVQEEIIRAFGCGRFSIILCLHNNKGGKTATGVNILKNVFWEEDKEWFPGHVYREWPFKSRQGRIIGTVKNTADDGPIRKEIQHWWPSSRYESSKAGKKYFSQYRIDSGWEFDVMTYEQEPQEFEGPFLSWTWCDEPPPERIVGAITSRFVGGGIWLVTATPINCGPFLNVIDDLRDRKKSISILNASIYDFSIKSGKPNHKNTKRGLWTDEQIEDYVAGIPPDEVDARVHGKANAKSGMVYAGFSRRVHVIGGEDCPYKSFNFDSAYVRASNAYCTMDPHRKGYPAIQWWLHTPDEEFICYNEWPTFAMLNSFYDEVRRTQTCNYTVEEIARFMAILDGTQWGLKVLRRAMDPRFGRATDGEFGRKTDSLMGEYAKYISPIFELPQAERIDVQRDRIRELLRFNPAIPVGPWNKPKIYYLPHCKNSIRAIERHYWDEDNEREAERYKDFVDPFRYLLALLRDGGYIPALKPRREVLVDPVEADYPMHSVALG